MNKIIFDLNKLNVVNYNTDCKLFQFAVSIPSFEGIEKTITRQIRKMKLSSTGEKIYTIENQDELTSFLKTPLEFNLNDILENKKKQIIASQSEFNNCLLFETNLQDSINLASNYHKADSGFKLIRLHPNGSALLNQINFESPIKKAKIHIENNDSNVIVQYSLDGNNFLDTTEFIINEETEFSTIYLLFKNQMPVTCDINSFYILF